jgi:hypothetical protein
MQPLAALLPGIASPCPIEAPVGRKMYAKDRASAWRQDLERRTAGLIAAAKTTAEHQAIETAYTQELERGAPFGRVRHDAKFVREPSRTRLDRNGLARLEVQWQWLVRRMTRTDRKAAHDSGQRLKRSLSRSTVDVMGALIYLARKYPAVFPSIEGIAAIANVCRRTAVAAVATLENWGVVRIERRRKRVVSPTGGIAETQDTSVYVLQEPQGLAAMALRIFGWKAECKTCPASENSTTGLAKKGADQAPELSQLIALPEQVKGSNTRIPWWAMLRR